MSKIFKDIEYESFLVMPDGKVALYDNDDKPIMVIDAIKEGIIIDFREELFNGINNKWIFGDFPNW